MSTSTSNCWRAEFLITDSIVLGLVDHTWNSTHTGACAPGPELASGSPWRWHVVGLERGDVCGRAETPVSAAFAAENVVVAAGAVHKRTAIRRGT